MNKGTLNGAIRGASRRTGWIMVWILVLLTACAIKEERAPIPLTGGPGDALYLKAEKKFQDRYYNEALGLYNDYLAMYSESPLAPSAMLKIGAIHVAEGEYETARSVYLQMIAAYPQSRLIGEAHILLLSTYYQEGEYQQVVDNAAIIDDVQLSPEERIRKNAIVGDAYLALGEYAAATHIYFNLFKDVSASEQSRLIRKIETAAAHLAPDKIAEYYGQTDDERLKGILLYLQGTALAAESRFEEAINTLTEFVDCYPEDERAPDARFLIERYTSSGAFRPYTIGCLLPLSGKYQTFGMNALKGIESAMGRFGEQYPDTEVRIVIRDTGADPLKAAAYVRELVEEEKVAVIIGPILTAQAAALAAQELQAPIITFSQKNNIVEIGDYVFRHFLTPEMQVDTIVDYAMIDLGLRRFAILYPNEKYGETFMHLFWDAVVDKGGTVVGVENYEKTQADFAAPIKKLVGLYYKVPQALQGMIETYKGYPVPPGPNLFGTPPVVEPDEMPDEKAEKEQEAPEPIVDFDAVFIPDGPEKANLLLPQLTYYDVVDVYLFGTNLWHSDELIRTADQHVQGAILPEIFFDKSENAIVKDFVRYFGATFGEPPGFLEAITYDTAMMIFQIMRQPHIRFRATIKNALVDMPGYHGVTGITRFKKSGEVVKQLYLLQVRGDGFFELPRYSTITDVPE